MVVECKYRNKPVSLSVLEHLKESITIFPYDYYDIYLFSKSGFTDDLIKLEEELIHLITIDEMMN